LFPKIEDWNSFVCQVSLICNLIIEATETTETIEATEAKEATEAVDKKTHLVSADEKTGIQALSRLEVPMSPGKDTKREYEYNRNGTTTLIAGFDVGKGNLINHHLGPTRTEKDFLAFCENTVALYAKEDDVVFLVDQLNTHKSASLVEWVAKETDCQKDLGVKGQKGILKNMASRKAFLENSTHRIRFVYTPKHCSWLNPIENWFGKLQRHIITKGNFDSVEELNTKIETYIDYYNQCMIIPLKWKFKGFNKEKKLENYIIVET